MVNIPNNEYTRFVCLKHLILPTMMSTLVSEIYSFFIVYRLDMMGWVAFFVYVKVFYRFSLLHFPGLHRFVQYLQCRVQMWKPHHQVRLGLCPARRRQQNP